MELQAHGALVPVAVDVVDALGVEGRRAPDDAVHLVPLSKKKKKNPSTNQPHKINVKQPIAPGLKKYTKPGHRSGPVRKGGRERGGVRWGRVGKEGVGDQSTT